MLPIDLLLDDIEIDINEIKAELYSELTDNEGGIVIKTKYYYQLHPSEISLCSKHFNSLLDYRDQKPERKGLGLYRFKSVS